MSGGVDAGVREQQAAAAREDEESPESEEEQQGRGVINYHFEEKVSGKKYSLVVDDYIEDHNYDEIPHIHGDYDDIKDKLKITSRGKDLLKIAVEVFAVMSSCFLTYTVSNHDPFLPAVISQAVVIMIALVSFPEISAASAAGAFAGMASSDAIINYGWLCFLSIVVSVMWLIFNRFKLLVGFGGRIGTCAFMSMNIVSLIAMISGKVPWSLYGNVNELWSQGWS